MIIVYILIAILAIIVNVWISAQFMDVAETKGYYEMKYFWICFFLGITGYLLVIALPNIASKHNSSSPAQKNPNDTKPSYLSKYSTPKEVGNSRISENEKMCAYCGQRQPTSNTICMNCGERI